MAGLYEADFDESDPKATARIRAFLNEYKVLCKKHDCLVVAAGDTADGDAVEVCPSEDWAKEDDPWEVEYSTKERGWKI